MGILKKVLPPENRSIYAISKESGISRQIAEDFQKEYPEIPLQYIWHPDEGFQRTAITNRAVFSARAEYLIITDGDCLPAPDFVKVHWSARKQNTFCNGRRLLLSWEYSKSLVSEDILSGKFMTFPVAESEKEILRRHLKSYFYLLIRRKSRLRLMAANLSLFREDMLRVNGFDERFKGWGATDEDLCRRLFRMGMKWKSLYTRARVWHIAHPPVPSKPSKVKLGTNIPYYERGFFLTRPIYGVRKREIADLNVLVEIDGTFSGNENIADIFQSLFPKSRIICKGKMYHDAMEKNALKELHIIFTNQDKDYRFLPDYEEHIFWWNSINTAGRIPFHTHFLLAPMEIEGMDVCQVSMVEDGVSLQDLTRSLDRLEL